MAITELGEGCSLRLGTELANSFNMTDFVNLVSVLNYISVRQFNNLTQWQNIKLDLPSFRANCGDTNHIDPTSLETDQRYGSMCTYDLAVKICDEHIIGGLVGLQGWINELMRQLWIIAPTQILQIIYDALGADVMVRQSGKSGPKMLTFAQDVTVTNPVIDMTTSGITYVNFMKIMAAAARYSIGRRLVFFMPFGAANALRADLMKNSHCCTTVGQLGDGFDTMTQYGNITIIHPFEGKSGFGWLQPTPTTIRGYVFVEGAVELAYCNESTVSEGTPSKNFIPIKPSVDNGFMNGKLIINGDTRAGGVDLYAKLAMGAMRAIPEGVIAVDFKKTDVL